MNVGAILCACFTLQVRLKLNSTKFNLQSSTIRYAVNTYIVIQDWLSWDVKCISDVHMWFLNCLSFLLFSSVFSCCLVLLFFVVVFLAFAATQSFRFCWWRLSSFAVSFCLDFVVICFLFFSFSFFSFLIFFKNNFVSRHLNLHGVYCLGASCMKNDTLFWQLYAVGWNLVH